MIGRYEIVREVGRGGAAIVYLARQHDLDRDIALKELAGFQSLDPALAERFAREARVAGSLAHPNIVTVLEAFEHGGVPYIAMEYLQRGSLRPLVGQLQLVEVAGVLEGVLAGLDHAAARGVVHRDIKPENVLVSAEGRIKITDFGVAKAYNQAWTAHYRTATGMTLGTPTYMAPEQAMGREISTRTDLYAVGVMAYELLAGTPPFHGIDEPMAILLRHVTEPPPPLTQVAPSLDPALAAWVMRLLEKEPDDRPASPQAAWEALEDVVVRLLGPLWRRDARLSAPGEAPAIRPLTPAPFGDADSAYRTFGAPPTSAPADRAAETALPTAGPPPARPLPVTPAQTAIPVDALVASPGEALTVPPTGTPEDSPATPSFDAVTAAVTPTGTPEDSPATPSFDAMTAAAPQRRRRHLLLGGALLVLLSATGVALAAFAGAFGGGSSSPAAQAVKGLPACFEKLAAKAVELPRGIDVPLGERGRANGRTLSLLLEDGHPIGLDTVSVHDGSAPYYRVEGTRDIHCRPVAATVIAKDTYPNFVNYDKVRNTIGGRPYDVELSTDDNGKLSANVDVPAAPRLRASATRDADAMRVDGTLPDNAYGAVNVVYRATRSDGSELVRTAPLAPEHGEFSTTFKLGHADRHLGKGTVTVDFLGDSAYQAARTTVPVPAA